MQLLYKCLAFIAVVAFVNGSSFSAYGAGAELPLPDFFCAIGSCVDVEQEEPPAPASQSQGAAGTINWNPGVYVGFKPGQFYAVRNDFEGGWRSRSEIEDVMSRFMCEPQHANIRGARIRLEWGEYEGQRGDYSSGDELLEIMHRFLSSGDCGGIPRQLSIQTDFQANNRDAREELCVPVYLRNPTDMFAWQNGGGTDRCAARVYTAQSQAFDRYIELWDHITSIYGDSPFVEQFSVKLEGSFGINARDSAFNSTRAQERIRDMAVHVRNRAPRVASTIGANNFSSGFHDDLLTVHKVAFDAVGGMGISWPDTFTSTSSNPNWRTPPVTPHEGYYHLFQGDHMMWGEWQIAGNRFTSFESVIEACCDPSYRNLNGGVSPYIQGPPPNTAHGSTHVVVITTFADFPVDDAVAAFDARPNGYDTFDMTCPDAWLDRGLQCVNNQGQVVR